MITIHAAHSASADAMSAGMREQIEHYFEDLATVIADLHPALDGESCVSMERMMALGPEGSAS